MVNDCYESMIEAANQSELEATRDQHLAREKSGTPFTSDIDSAYDRLKGNSFVLTGQRTWRDRFQ